MELVSVGQDMPYVHAITSSLRENVVTYAIIALTKWNKKPFTDRRCRSDAHKLRSSAQRI